MAQALVVHCIIESNMLSDLMCLSNDYRGLVRIPLAYDAR